MHWSMAVRTIALISLVAALKHLLGAAPPETIVLPLGLPWLGAHFRIDALVGLLSRRRRSRRRRRQPVRARLWPPRGRAAARAAVLSGLPRRHESGGAGRRCLHLSRLLGIHVAHLVGAGDGAPSRARQRATPATSISSWRASARSPCCWPSACSPAPTASTPSRDPRRAPDRGARGAGADPRSDRRRLEGRPGAAARLAAARASGGAEPRLGADERRDDQGRGLRLRAHRVRPARAAGLVVEHGGARARRRHRRDGRALCADAARPQAAARLSHGREYRHHLHRARPGARLQGARHGRSRRRWRSPPRCSTSSIIRCSRACCSSAPAPC